MSLLIIKEYLEILLINKMLKHQWLFWELNLIVTIILENDTGMPWKNLLLNVIYVFYAEDFQQTDDFSFHTPEC